MIATLRTSRLLPALLAATLLLGVGLPLVQYACAMSGQTMTMSPLSTSALNSSEHDQETHAPAAAMDKLCDGVSPDDCTQPLPECSEAQTRSVSEAPVLLQRGDHAPAQLLLPLVAHLTPLTSTAESGPRVPHAPEDDGSPRVPPRLLFAVLLL